MKFLISMIPYFILTFDATLLTANFVYFTLTHFWESFDIGIENFMILSV